MNQNLQVIKPAGILNGIRGNDLRREVNEVMTKGTDIVLIDLEDVKFIDSAGLGSLISIMNVVRTAGGKLFICSMSGQVRMLFELTKMERIFEKFADRDEFNRFFLAEERKC